MKKETTKKSSVTLQILRATFEKKIAFEEEQISVSQALIKKYKHSLKDTVLRNIYDGAYNNSVQTGKTIEELLPEIQYAKEVQLIFEANPNVKLTSAEVSEIVFKTNTISHKNYMSIVRQRIWVQLRDCCEKGILKETGPKEGVKIFSMNNGW